MKNRKGKWLIALNGKEPIIGPIAIDEGGLLAIHPVIVKRGERRVIRQSGSRSYLLEELVDSYENRQNDQKYIRGEKRQNIEWSDRTETEQLALAICAAAAKYRGDISLFLDEMGKETVINMKAFLQTILEGETRIDWSAFLYKVRKMPERRYKPGRKKKNQ